MAKGNFDISAASKLLGIQKQLLMKWQQEGLVPAGKSFGFKELLAARTVKKLREAQIAHLRLSVL